MDQLDAALMLYQAPEFASGQIHEVSRDLTPGREPQGEGAMTATRGGLVVAGESQSPAVSAIVLFSARVATAGTFPPQS
jgi:hypothetical protein